MVHVRCNEVAGDADLLACLAVGPGAAPPAETSQPSTASSADAPATMPIPPMASPMWLFQFIELEHPGSSVGAIGAPRKVCQLSEEILSESRYFLEEQDDSFREKTLPPV
jgi:hypothetical protein